MGGDGTAAAESRIEAKLDALLVTTTRIETEIGNRGRQIDDHEQRLRDHADQIQQIRSQQATTGRFTWGDVFRVVAALAAGGSLLAMFVGVVLAVNG